MPDFIHPTRFTSLMKVKRYSGEKHMEPVACKVIGEDNGTTRLVLRYDKETSATVAITPKQGWFRMELVAAGGLADIDEISWGPINTRCEGPVGAFFGLVRSDDTTLGMMSLEPNTDGLNVPYTEASFWLPWQEGGSYLQLVSQDHTRSRILKGGTRSSDPAPEITPVGSAVALYSSPKGRELDIVEKIVVAEKLPHPKHKGVWSKRSPEILRPGIWGKFNSKNIDQYFDLTADLHGGEICGFHTMFGNWGHFEIDPKLYPKGMDDIRSAVKQGQKKGIGLSMYTLTNFVQSRSIPEPFIFPIPHPDFETYDLESTLRTAIDIETTQITLAKSSELVQILKKLTRPTTSPSQRALLWIDDEFIHATKFHVDGNTVILGDCERGHMMTTPATHSAKARVRILYFAGYRSVFPGTLALNEKVAHNIGRVTREGGFSKVTFDGHESALQTGHGAYAMNRTCKIVYDANIGRDLTVTGSRITNYCWHMLSYISWGEHDMHKGFRGSMLDYRLRRQDQLSRALMPHKMGQHYPTKASLEDMNWLCGLATGWDSGLELSIKPDEFKKNPDHSAILKAVTLWEKARLSGKLTDDQKMRLRQVDCVYDIKQNPDGGFSIALKKRWRHEGVKILPPSTITFEEPDQCRVEPSSIDLGWLHCPLVAVSAALSDDIVVASDTETGIKVFYPGPDASGRERQAFQCVLRVPAAAATGILNPRLGANGKTFVVPTEIKPGQYLAFTADLAIVHLYGADHRLIRDIHIRHLNDLPGVPRGKSFDVEMFLPSAEKGTPSKARINLYAFQPILKKEKRK
ncbi:MAG: hypothetical protein V3V05_09700 [Pontiella sp.]